ncbi:MAG TPA: hypothetical protein PLP07_10430 [Pyrinomonadaceae bacterium]|nr:hypothetical protein [Chloracidobacterium sp.]MBP9934772.1 hypothetical protein [Pyrinomonadaceae bacterium]MBK7803197.1 hypothetical protein [Chloracidobacterium sp.]MBK9438157.1 hypothetical protein [Chloracidobacterium sp.]MBL0240968.1 hypothetical protein [Chloracidobacterium sp.]
MSRFLWALPIDVRERCAFPVRLINDPSGYAARQERRLEPSNAPTRQIATLFTAWCGRLMISKGNSGT